MENLFVEVTSANNAFLQNPDGTAPGRVGSAMTISNNSLPDDVSPTLDLFEETEVLTVLFEVGIEAAPWGLNFALYGVENGGTQRASRAPLVSFTIDSSMLDLEGVPQLDNVVELRIFLPIVQ